MCFQKGRLALKYEIKERSFTQLDWELGPFEFLQEEIFSLRNNIR